MKKLLGILLAVVMMFSMVAVFAACNGGNDETEDIKVAMITDYGDITDQSFNQTTYEACKEFCEANEITFKYYKPTGDSTEARCASIDQAIDDGYNVIVMPGYAFAGAIVESADQNPDVKFIALDVGKGDLFEAKYSDYDYNPENPAWTYTLPENVCSFVYQEELAGYMAGYAAVKDGYEKLGFLGGMAVPAVIRYGYGFVQGANQAAVELGKTSSVSIKYVYGGQFYGDAAITAVMDTWYQNGTEVVFACGGGIYSSACEAATKTGINGKVIGVDVDQYGVISNTYGDICVTSAMKGLAPTVKMVLKEVIDGNWSKYSTKIETLGLVSGTDASLNYVQIPTASASWKLTTFTVADYEALVAKLFNGTLTVSNSTSVAPTVSISVDYQANIK